MQRVLPPPCSWACGQASHAVMRPSRYSRAALCQSGSAGCAPAEPTIKTSHAAYDAKQTRKSIAMMLRARESRPETGQSEEAADAKAKAGEKIAIQRVKALAGVDRHIGDNKAGGAARALVFDAPRGVDPGRKARVGGDQERLPHLDGAEHAACQVHVELAGAPEPTVIGEVHQNVRLLRLGAQLGHLPADQMRHCAFEADVG